MNDVAAVFQHERHDFVLRTDNSLWVMGAATSPWMGLVVPNPYDATRLVGCVRDVVIDRDNVLVLQCSGHLWAFRNGDIHLLIEEVESFYIPPQMPLAGGLLGGAFVLQTDNSLWTVPIMRRDNPPEHILDDVQSVYRADNLGTFVIQNCGTLWSWGSNEFGQLGIGTGHIFTAPVRVMDNVASIYPFGWGGTFAITTDNQLWGWGSNSRGQLGTEEEGINQYYPVHIKNNVRYVASLWNTTFVIGTDNSLWMWGASLFDPNAMFFTSDFAWRMREFSAIDLSESINLDMTHVMDDVVSISMLDSNDVIIICTQNTLHHFGRGWGMEQHVYNPRAMLDNVAWFTSIGGSVFAVQEDDTLWAFGFNWLAGGLGDGTTVDRNDPINISYAFSYASGSAPMELGAIAVEPTRHEPPALPFFATFSGTNFFIDQNNRLWSWGDDWGGRLGRTLAHNQFYDNVPAIVMDNVVYVAGAGVAPLYLIRGDGSMWEWGEGALPSHTTESAVMTALTLQIENYALTKDGDLLHWYRPYAHLSLPGTEELGQDERIIMSDLRWLYQFGHSLFAIETNGNLWSWGADTVGMLGHGTPQSAHDIVHRGTARLNPYESREMILPNIAKLINNGMSMYTIQSDGSLWAWGDNSQGQLGDGTRQNRYSPVFIMDGVTSLDAQGTSVIAIRADGSAWAWGVNALGQLGDGTYISRLTPTPIMDAPRQVFMFDNTIYAITHDDGLWAWGNGFGHTPVNIMQNVSAVYRDNIGRIYVISGGDLWDISGAVPEFVMADVSTMVASGANFVVTNSGELWGWGSNWNGQLGDADEDVARGSAVRILFE